MNIDQNTPITDLVVLAGNLFNVAIRSAAILLAILIVFGGVKLATSLGDPKGFESAKKIFTYSLIGFLVIVFFFVFIRVIFSVIGIEEDFLNPSAPFNRLIEGIEELDTLIRKED